MVRYIFICKEILTAEQEENLFSEITKYIPSLDKTRVKQYGFDLDNSVYFFTYSYLVKADSWIPVKIFEEFEQRILEHTLTN